MCDFGYFDAGICATNQDIIWLLCSDHHMVWWLQCQDWDYQRVFNPLVHHLLSTYYVQNTLLLI
jgi:hypothetical protein